METQKKLKKSVQIRLQKEAKRAENEANKGRLGAATASYRNVPTSPQKMRLLADMVRGMRVERALAVLKYDKKVGARYLEKTLLSAISNWTLKNSEISLEDANLVVATIFVDGGRMLKRLRPAPQGRAYRVRKRSNHITLVVDSAPVIAEKVVNKILENTEN